MKKFILLALFVSTPSFAEIKTYFCSKIKSMNTGGRIVNFWCYLDNGTVSQMFMSPTEDDINGPFVINNDVYGKIQLAKNADIEGSRTNGYVTMLNSFNIIKRTVPTSTIKLRVQTRTSNTVPGKEVINNLSIEE